MGSKDKNAPHAPKEGKKIKKKKLKGTIKQEKNNQQIISKPSKKFKNDVQMKLKEEKKDVTFTESTGKKEQKEFTGIPDLEDASLAGTDRSSDCTLIVAVGEAVKSLAIAGLEVVERNTFGVYILKRKIANVRDTPKECQASEIMNITKILGLQPGKEYQSMMDLKTLRYGKIMIMADHDPDGSFSKGLLINALHYQWPSLIQFPFVEEFITPIVKVTRGDEGLSFFSLPKYEDWKRNTGNSSTYKIKFYKGLGTLTAKEIKECFSDLQRHTVPFQYNDTDDDTSIEMAFSRKYVAQRKKELCQLTRSSEELETWLPAHYIYGEDITRVSFSDFIHKELAAFSYATTERFIPNIIDGLRTVQRKVLYTCLKRNIIEERSVMQLAGSVLETSAHHDGEQMLLSAITGLAHNFVGSNNINLLEPIGQFGSRLQGGKDAASPHYIFTKLSPLTRYIFHPHDDFLLTHRSQNGRKIEPVCYIPILPMVLVNGANSAGLGCSSVILSYNPRDIVENLKRMLEGEEPTPMQPWYKNFQGTIKRMGTDSLLIVFGECAFLDEDSLEITELPIGTWTLNYKERVLNQMLLNDTICDVHDFSTDTSVRYVVTMTQEKLKEAEERGLYKTFQLHNKRTCNWSAFDANCQLKKYEDEIHVLEDFYSVRLEYYKKRKNYLLGLLEAECSKLKSQARFIKEKNSGKLVVEGKEKTALVTKLLENGYSPDPVRSWKLQQSGKEPLEEDQEVPHNAMKQDREEMFDYLLDMPLWSFTKKRQQEILAELNDKLQESEELKTKDPSSLWQNDLDEFLKKLDEVEALERETGGIPEEMKLNETKPSKHRKLVKPVLNETDHLEEKKKIGKKRGGQQSLNGFDETHRLSSPEKSKHEQNVKRKAPDTFKQKNKKKKMTYNSDDHNV